jgi:uncharacterized Ntn-hydrolase superfamily protein
MTFSLIGRCPRTGQFGAVAASSAIAIGARATHCAAGVGAVLTQHRTDPRLGLRGLELLRAGHDAQQTIDALVAGNPHAPWRQLAALDATGKAAFYSGNHTRPDMSEVAAQDACATGNDLINARVTAAMLMAFQTDPLAPLAERLVVAVEAGLAAGGQHRDVRSAHLLVVERHAFPLIDLRVDWHPAPIAELRALWLRYAPQIHDFELRALDPARAPMH